MERTDVDLIRDVKRDILRVFTYPERVMDKLKNMSDKVLQELEKDLGYNTEMVKESLNLFRENIRKKYITMERITVLYVHFLRAIKKTLWENTNIGKKKFNEKYSFEFEELIHFGGYLQKDGDGFHYGEYKSNEQKYEKQINTLVDLFNANKRGFKVKKIFRYLNRILGNGCQILAKYFMEDLKHKYRLEEVISYQKKVESIFDKIPSKGELDTTRDLMSFVRDILHTLGIDDEKVKIHLAELGYKDKRSKENQESNLARITKMRDFGRGEYPIKAVINKEELNLTNSYVLKDLQNRIEYNLNNKKINFDQKELDRGTFIKITDKDKIDIKKVLDLKYDSINQISLFVGANIKKIEWKVEDFIEIESNGFRIKSIGQILKNKEKLFKERIHLWTDKEGKEHFETIQLISIKDGEITLTFRVFDLIEYFIELSLELHDFFIRDLNLKAILQRKKYTEKWDGTRGYLDVGATIRHSLRRGWIQPMQTYRKKQIEDPPLIFVNYDISSSMGGATRTSQFLVFTILSFFERDIRKFFIGYITRTNRTNEGNLFPSDILLDENKFRKSKNKFNLLYEYKKVRENAKGSIGFSSFGEVSKSYFDYEYGKALRDFLDNRNAGKTGTDMSIFNLMERHPDMDMIGLKYVFLVTDAELTQDIRQKRDIVRVAKTLIDRPDVKFFYLWIISASKLNSEAYLVPDRKFHFVTKQQIGRKLYNMTWDESEGKFIDSFSTDSEEIDYEYYKFIWDYWEHIYIATPTDIRYVGEIKHILKKLEEIDFFIP
jgi:hypothetical protein